MTLVKTQSETTFSKKRALALALFSMLLIGFAGTANADRHYDDHHHDYHHYREVRGHRYYTGGYYGAPPVVYGGAPAYYAPPPVVYAPQQPGINLNIGIR